MIKTSNEAVYSGTFFDEQSNGSLISARVVLKELFDFAEIRSVVDIGCGVGPWLRAAIELGATRTLGIDGDYVERDKLLVDRNLFRACDLECSNVLHVAGDDAPFDVAICMEVAEHLPPLRASSFIEEVCKLSNLVLFSAAVPGQGGANHLNENWPGYWATLFSTQGFLCFDVLRGLLWDHPECEWWYLQNVLVFAKQSTVAEEITRRLGQPSTASPLSLIHPRMVTHCLHYASAHIAEQVAKYRLFDRDETTRALETKLDLVRRKLEEEEARAERLASTLKSLNAEMGRVSDQRDLLAREHAALLGSTSWRMTGPLRRIAEQLRR